MRTRAGNRIRNQITGKRSGGVSLLLKPTTREAKAYTRTMNNAMIPNGLRASVLAEDANGLTSRIMGFLPPGHEFLTLGSDRRLENVASEDRWATAPSQAV
jgi:hypothetical protein